MNDPEIIPESMPRRALRYAMSGLFFAAGIAHFRSAGAFISIVPAMLPRPDLLVEISGVIELVLASSFFIPRARRITAILLILLMLAVWPANINMALHPERYDVFTPLELWLRVALQIPMMFWALYAGGVWPSPSRATAQSESR